MGGLGRWDSRVGPSVLPIGHNVNPLYITYFLFSRELFRYLPLRDRPGETGVNRL